MALPNEVQVDSTMVQSLGFGHKGWDNEGRPAQDLYVRFRTDGSIYKYYMVPMKTIQALVNAESIGGFLQENILKNDIHYLRLYSEPIEAEVKSMLVYNAVTRKYEGTNSQGEDVAMLTGPVYQAIEDMQKRGSTFLEAVAAVSDPDKWTQTVTSTFTA